MNIATIPVVFHGETPAVIRAVVDTVNARLTRQIPTTENIADSDETIVLIVTGRYSQASPEENELVTSIMGGDSQERFNVYFNWYNTVHEVGHIVERIALNNKILRGEEIEWGFMDSELFANAFAVAFWAHYGDEETLNMLRELVPYAAYNENFTRPVAEDEDIFDFARLYAAGEIDGTFNNYGWFQFNLVNYVLNEMRDLESVLRSIGFDVGEAPPQRVLTFSSIGEEAIPEILTTVFTVLRDDWGIEMPADMYVYHMLSDDPNQHSVITLNSETTRFIREILGLDEDDETPIFELLGIVISLDIDEDDMTRVWPHSNR